MPTIKEPSFHPKINEYIYDKLMNATYEQKKGLNSRELALINNKKRLEGFCKGGFIDRKLAMLTKMGIEWHLTFFESSETFRKLLVNVYRQHQMKSLRVDNIESAWRKGVFVITSKQIALSLMMMGENSTKRFINTDFMKVSEKMAFARSIVKDNSMNPEHIRSQASVRSASRYMLHTLLLDNFLAGEGLMKVDFLIMLVLFDKPNDYFERETVELALHPTYKDRTIQTRSFLLFQDGYLEKVPTRGKQPIYTITAKGISTVGRAIGIITNKTENL